MKIERHYDFHARRERCSLVIGHARFYSAGRLVSYGLSLILGAIQQVYRERNIALGGCEHCGSFWQLAMRGPWTCYVWDGKGEDPNRPMKLCPDCGADADDYWADMWAQVRNGW